MADPLSSAASLIAVLGFSLQSCKYLVGFFQGIAGAPTHVRHNVLWLQALHSTLSELHGLSKDIHFHCAHIELPSGFNARIEECKTDLLETESRIRRVSQNLQGTRMLQTWTRVKYSFAADQWLANFFRRLQTYHTVFTLDLMTTQIKLTLVNFKAVENPPPITTINQSAADVNSQLTRFLNSYSQPISVRASSWCSLETCLGRFVFWSGPTMKQRWSNKRFEYVVSSLKGERGFGFQVYFGRQIKRRGISIAFVLMMCPRPPGSWTIKWNISVRQVLPREADIFEFVRTGNLEAVKSMFNMRKASPMQTSPDGTGLLHIAAGSKSLEMVRLLLQEGVEINSGDEDGQTPLHFAIAKSGNYDICRTLLEHCADLGNRDVVGKTPLHVFFSPVVGLILTNHRGAIDEEVAKPDASGMTILQYTAWSSKSEPRHLVPYIQSGEVYPLLSRDYTGRSLLHFTAQRGNIAILKYLLGLSHDIGLNSRDIIGQSVLHYATHSKRTEAIEFLLSNGADINAVDKNGWTVLHSAAARNNTAAVELVVKLCGRKSLYMRDRDGRTPAELAYRYKAFKAAEYLSSLTKEDMDLERHHCPSLVECTASGASRQACYTRLKFYESIQPTIFAVALLWYIFYALKGNGI